MLQIKTMPIEQYMNSECNTEKLQEMYNRLNSIPHGKYAPRLYWAEKGLYEAGGRIHGGGDCICWLSYREGYGYTLIDVGDRGSWSCGVYLKEQPEPKYEYIAFYDGEFEEVFKRFEKIFGKQEWEKTWQDKLEELKAENARFGEKMNNGISGKEAHTLIVKAEEELNVSLPSEYISILKVVNGVEFNGFIIYGADEEFLNNAPSQMVNGLIDNNKVLYENEWQKKYLFLGESSISWYAYDAATQKYLELDKPSGDVVKEYTTFDDLLKKIFTDALM